MTETQFSRLQQYLARTNRAINDMRGISAKNSYPHVLVVGGGFAGVCAAEVLVRSRPHISVTLVASQDYFEFLPSALRCLVHPDHIDRISANLRNRKFDFMHGTVVSLSRNEAAVQLHSEPWENSNSPDHVLHVHFAYCIWAVGVAYPSPVKTLPSLYSLKQREAELDDTKGSIMAAKSILIIGGGLVGVELAGELCEGLPNPSERTITIATSHRGLLPRLPTYAGVYATKWLKDRGVSIVLSRVKCARPCDGISGDDPLAGMQSFTREDGGTPICADLAFECTGGWRGAGCSALSAGGLAAEEDMNSYGQVAVRGTLQLKRAMNIFAAGDCAVVDGELDRAGCFAEKTAYSAMEAGRLAARNVCRLVSGRSARPFLETFPWHAFPMGFFPRLFAVSLYNRDGVLCLGPVVVTGKLAAFGKWFTERLGVAALRGSRFFEVIFGFVERIIFFFTVVVQLIFKGGEL